MYRIKGMIAIIIILLGPTCYLLAILIFNSYRYLVSDPKLLPPDHIVNVLSNGYLTAALCVFAVLYPLLIVLALFEIFKYRINKQ